MKGSCSDYRRVESRAAFHSRLKECNGIGGKESRPTSCWVYSFFETEVNMKKFINDPYDVVDEMLEGFLDVHRKYVRKLDTARAVVRADAPVADKVGVVTGGGSGIGRASALAFAREGAKIVVADIEDEKGRETVHLIENKGGQAIFISADISKSEQVESMVAETVRAYGRLDCAHNNAGVLGTMDLTANYEEDEWERIMRINVTGTWLCIKYEVPQMLSQKSGAIVNTASILGLVGSGRAPAYSTSKHAVVGLTKSAALAYADSGIRINAVCPGFTVTPMIDPLTGDDPQIEADMAARHPIGRMAKPEEVRLIGLFSIHELANSYSRSLQGNSCTFKAG